LQALKNHAILKIYKKIIRSSIAHGGKTMNEEPKKEYLKPEISHELDLETKAGSPLGDPIIDPLLDS